MIRKVLLIVTGTLRVFDLDVYELLDPGATLSFVNPYIKFQFSVSIENLSELFVRLYSSRLLSYS